MSKRAERPGIESDSRTATRIQRFVRVSLRTFDIHATRRIDDQEEEGRAS
jgi:hypothetical protein